MPFFLQGLPAGRSFAVRLPGPELRLRRRLSRRPSAVQTDGPLPAAVKRVADFAAHGLQPGRTAIEAGSHASMLTSRRTLRLPFHILPEILRVYAGHISVHKAVLIQCDDSAEAEARGGDNIGKAEPLVIVFPERLYRAVI